MTGSPRPSGRIRLLVAGGGALLLAGIAMTSASFADQAKVNVGGATGIRVDIPVRLDIAVRDGQGGLQDAIEAAEAVVLPSSGAAGFTEHTPVVFEARFENRDPGVTGDLHVTVFDPDVSGAYDLFGQLRFTVYLQGSATPAASGLTAEEVNAASIVETVHPGGSLDVRIEAVIAAGEAVSAAGKSTQLGIRVDGNSP
ncbi:hypothetical protein [Agromyces archimandritae]|uniref:Uncharacterized protein n=1 Tax=Agromyces archimandritae TaxID=2781962 RepID=A0A975IMT2_9MICO|nr:hypothetical protein [Agromyces archimandritae]QTX03499.1 hypothetical protein G127AT_09010 [Agromyces archimandritae]